MPGMNRRSLHGWWRRGCYSSREGRAPVQALCHLFSTGELLCYCHLMTSPRNERSYNAGRKNPNSVLSPGIVDLIRQLWDQGLHSCAEIAELTGGLVSRQQVHRIATGVAWRNSWRRTGGRRG